jgi:transcription antitermination factor NusG
VNNLFNSPPSWYAIVVKPRHEKRVADLLDHKGFDNLLPTYCSTRRWTDRVVEVSLPLFPRYVFCKFELQNKLAVLKTPGVMTVVGVANCPVPIVETEMAALHAIVRSRLAAEPWPFLERGQTVCVERGPLAGLEGILLELKNKRRLIVSLTLVQRSVAVEMDGSWVRPAGHRRPASMAYAPYAKVG